MSWLRRGDEPVCFTARWHGSFVDRWHARRLRDGVSGVTAPKRQKSLPQILVRRSKAPLRQHVRQFDLGSSRQPEADDSLNFLQDQTNQLAPPIERRIGGRSRHFRIETGLVVRRGPDDDPTDRAKSRVADRVVGRSCLVEALGQQDVLGKVGVPVQRLSPAAIS